MTAVLVVIAATSREWATGLTEWITDHAADVELRDHFLFDRDDALELAFDCLVAEADWSQLDAGLVRELHRRHRTVVGVWDPLSPGSRERLLHLGVDRIVEVNDSPEAMLAEIVSAAQEQQRHLDAAAELERLVHGEPAADGAPPVVPTPPPLPPRSVLTVVTGALEGVGATEVAVECAAALRARNETVVLVDGDLVAPSLAQRLRTPLTANVFAAVDAMDQDPVRLQRALTTVARGGFDVLGGAEHPKHWQELDLDDLLAVLAALRRRYQHVLVNVGSQLEPLPNGRHDIARALVRAADRIVVVAHPSPTGLVRLSRWMVDAADLTEPGRVHVVCNRSEVGDTRADVDTELARTVACAGVWHIPSDRKVARAHWACTLAAPGRFTKAVRRLVDGAIPTSTAVRMQAGRPLDLAR